jgi:thioredoxin 1
MKEMIERLGLGLLLLALLAGILLGARWLYRLSQVRASRRLASHFAGAGPTVIYFTTPECVVCQRVQEPELEELERRWSKRVSVVKFDAIERKDLADKFRVLTVPTTIVINDAGQVVSVNNGLATAEDLARQLGLLELKGYAKA